MWAIWKTPRPQEERIAFMLASYNARPGHIIAAQRLVATGKDPNHWAPADAQLHRITGRQAEKTRSYVIRIKRFFLGLSRHPP